MATFLEGRGWIAGPETREEATVMGHVRNNEGWK